MPAPPKVSVLIPTYNYARFLPEAIDSVLAQDFGDFELLISDDGSEDGSAEIMRDYARRDPRIRCRAQERNLGMVPHWNWCLREARGPYVKFLFGDDKLASPRALGRMAAMLDAEPSATLAVTARVILGEDSRAVEVWDELGAPGRKDGREVIAQCLRSDRNLIGEPSATLFRRSAAERGFDPAWKQLVDEEMWFHLLSHGDLSYEPEPLCAFRLHSAQQTVVNRSAHVSSTESLLLLARYLDDFAAAERLKLDSPAIRRLLFHYIYYSRKNSNRDAARTPAVVAAEGVLMARLTPRWYAACLLLHRAAKPFVNLERWLRPRRDVRGRRRPRRFEMDSPRILVIRRRYLGDIVLLGSFLANLRLHWPSADIRVLVEHAYADVLALNRDSDDPVTLPRRRHDWPAFIAALRRARWTHVFNFENTEGTALLARLTGAPFRLGLHHGGYRLKMRGCYTHVVHDENEAHESRPITEYYLSTLAAAGVPIATREVRLAPREEDVAVLKTFVGAGGPVLLVHPGSRSPWRVWPADRFAAVCDRAQEELGAQVVLAGGPAEKAIIRDIRARARAHLFAFTEPLSVPRFAALASIAAVALCHDSGPMHVAAAVGTPVVALYGSQNTALFRPPGEGHTLLQAPLPCADCVAPDKCVPADSYRNYCVRRLTVDQVFEAVRHSLGEGG